MDQRNGDLTAIGHLLSPRKRRVLAGQPGLTPIESRLLRSSVLNTEKQSLLFQHTVFCQTCLPYRDPGDDVLVWDRSNGTTHLRIEAGAFMHPDTRQPVQAGLPYGPKARMLLMHINQKALAIQSPVVDIESSLTRFLREVLGLADNGRNMNTVHDQLIRLSASSVWMGQIKEDAAVTFPLQSIMQSFLVRKQRIWPGEVTLSPGYFESLMESAVPLDESHIKALSHNCMALDVYAWLAQRLHRVKEGDPQRISWPALHCQFGQGFSLGSMRKFRADFRIALRAVLLQYRQARVEDDAASRPRAVQEKGLYVWREKPVRGLLLHRSPPPVAKRLP